MDTQANNFVEVDYELYVPNESGNWDIVEKTSKDQPFRFVTGLGFTLPAFETHIDGLGTGDEFDFTIPVEEAYGSYTDEHVVKLKKEIFNINGKFDEARIYPGNVIPLANEDGNRFDGIVKEVGDDEVTIDLNHPLAGKELHFRGRIVSTHPATTEEINLFVKQMNGEDECGCCGHGEGCDGHHDDHCGHEGCGCRHHEA